MRVWPTAGHSRRWGLCRKRAAGKQRGHPNPAPCRGGQWDLMLVTFPSWASGLPVSSQGWGHLWAGGHWEPENGVFPNGARTGVIIQAVTWV